MEFEHVTFDLPHGTFHALQGGDPDGQPTVVLHGSARDLALIERLCRQWPPGFSLDPALQAELHEHLRASMPAPLKYYRAMLRPGMLGATRRLSQPITVPQKTMRGCQTRRETPIACGRRSIGCRRDMRAMPDPW